MLSWLLSDKNHQLKISAHAILRIISIPWHVCVVWQTFARFIGFSAAGVYGVEKNPLVQKLFQIEVWSFAVQSKSKSTAIPPSSIVFLLSIGLFAASGLEVEKRAPRRRCNLYTPLTKSMWVRNYELYASYKTMLLKDHLRYLGRNGDCSSQKDICYFLLDFWRRVD